MKYLLSILIALFIAAGIQAQTFKKVKIYINSMSDVQFLQQAGLEFDHASITKDQGLIVFLDDEEFSKLQMTNYNYDVLIDDWMQYYNSRPQLTEQEKQNFIRQSRENYNVSGFGFGSMGGFYTLAEVTAELDSMRMLYPNLITEKVSIGNSVEGRPTYMVKISDNPDVNEDEPEVLFTALHHAREPEGMMQLIYFMYYLLENYSTDASVKYLVDHREIYCIPVVNPDGYEYNHQMTPNGGYMWRKNKQDNNGNGTFQESYDGIDLNRNYGPYAYWNASNGGSSTYPGDETYRGEAPFSAPETANLRDFLSAHNIKCELNYHTFGNYLIYPYGALSMETPDSAIFREYSSDMTAYNGYFAGLDIQAVGYSTRGNSDDYAYDGDTAATHGKIFAMTPEVGSTGFWPLQSEIFPLAEENLMPNLYYTWAAGEFIKLDHPNYSQQYFNPGDVVEMTPSFRNKGLSAGTDIEINLSSLSSYAVVNNGTANFTSIPARSTVTVSSPLSFTIDGSAPAEENIKLLATVSTAGVVMTYDTLSIIVGVPTYAFVDSTNDPNSLWTITATPSYPKWESTTTSYISAPNSYTDSKNGNYLDDATVTMTLTNSLDLSSLTNPRLSYWTKWDIENNWDYGQVKISTNGGSGWTPLEGMYTNPGTGTFQPPGQPLYDGAQTSWVKEEILLSSFNLTNVKFQFQLKSDGYINRDGWYLDDIGVIYYTLIPVELSSFSASTDRETVTLSWKTSTETNNKGFEIQRASGTAAERTSEFSTIGYIRGSGTTTESSSYRFADNSPLQGKSIYRLKQVDFNGTFRVYGPVEIDYNGVSDYSILQNYPNPFNPSTLIRYAIPKAGNVEIKMYNLLGAEVATLVNEYKEAGRYSIEFSTENLPSKIGSGVYFYTIRAGSFVKTMKMIVLK